MKLVFPAFDGKVITMDMPKGTLIAIGGSEDRDNKPRPDEHEPLHVLKQLLNPRLQAQRIEVITSATEDKPEEWEKIFGHAFKKVGFDEVGFIHIKSREEAFNPEYAERLQQANAVYYTGGDQKRLIKFTGNTPVHKIIAERYQNDPDFTVAGTSAGAMAMSKVMIGGSTTNECHLKGEVIIQEGYGLVDECVFDTHFGNRSRWHRPDEPVIKYHVTGVGLDENTGVKLQQGQMEVIGYGHVTVVDGTSLKYTNIDKAKDGEKLIAEGLQLYRLNAGDVYCPKDHTINRGAAYKYRI